MELGYPVDSKIRFSGLLLTNILGACHRESCPLKPTSMSSSATFSRRVQNVVSPGKFSAHSRNRYMRTRPVYGTRPESTERSDVGSLKDNLRILFRNIAQPVAVVTSFMPNAVSCNASARPAKDTQNPLQTKFHGATLSSFTSIAMDPYPLVSFALRIPSRMATTLSSLPATISAHMVVNLLSANQASTAIAFSRPDLHPAPFTNPNVQYTLSEEGLPVLEGVVGALSCKLVRKGIPLYDLDYLGAWNEQDAGEDVVLQKEDVTSELFIARVVRVESVHDRTPPLVYHQRTYTTCKNSTQF